MIEPKKLAIACQGGGSHTAFTAGVLKHLFATGVHSHYEIVGLSGTSGGGICALLCWYGLLKAAKGSQEPISKPLIDFWSDNSAKLGWEKWLNNWTVQSLRLQDRGAFPAVELSPYSWEGLEKLWLPLAPRAEFLDFKALLEKHIAFADLPQLVSPASPRLLLGAVNVRSGAFKAFDSKQGEISVETVLASTAIPFLFRAVQVKEDFYWDGLFAENPPIAGLVQDRPDEIWVIQINRSDRPQIPTTSTTIFDRRNELAGNVSLHQAIHGIERVNEWLKQGAFKETYLAQVPLKPIAIRQIEISAQVSDRLDYASKLDRHPAFIKQLIEDGERQAEQFLITL